MKGDARSAAFPFQVQLEARIASDAELSALLGAGAAAYPYLTLGLTTEVASSTFDKWGNLGQLRVDIWTERALYANSQGLVIYDHLKRLFQSARFPLTTSSGTLHDLVTCTVDLVLDVADPDGKSQHTQVLIAPRSQQRVA
jgi:hypothetical protein